MTKSFNILPCILRITMDRLYTLEHGSIFKKSFKELFNDEHKTSMTSIKANINNLS